MRGGVLLALVLSLVSVAVAADGWSHYQNSRYGYSVDVPAGFSSVQEADNGDGGTSASPQGKATLAIWGANLLVDTFKSDAGQRIEDASASGWDIGYKTVKAKAATWSGTMGDRILYVHGAPGCDGQAAYFKLEYDASAKDEFDAIVRRMAKSFSAKGECL